MNEQDMEMFDGQVISEQLQVDLTNRRSVSLNISYVLVPDVVNQLIKDADTMTGMLLEYMTSKTDDEEIEKSRDIYNIAMGYLIKFNVDTLDYLRQHNDRNAIALSAILDAIVIARAIRNHVINAFNQKHEAEVSEE